MYRPRVLMQKPSMKFGMGVRVKVDHFVLHLQYARCIQLTIDPSGLLIGGHSGISNQPTIGTDHVFCRGTVNARKKKRDSGQHHHDTWTCVHFKHGCTTVYLSLVLAEWMNNWKPKSLLLIKPRPMPNMQALPAKIDMVLLYKIKRGLR